MAKRASPDEQPFRPLLDMSLVSAASGKAPESQAAIPRSERQNENKIVELPRSEATVISRSVTRMETAQEVRKPQEIGTKLDHEKRVLLTKAETQGIDRLVTSLANRLNSQVKVSHLMRAMVGLLIHAEGHLDKRAGEVGRLVRPANGDPNGLERFEFEIGKIVAAAIRDAGPR